MRYSAFYPRLSLALSLCLNITLGLELFRPPMAQAQVRADRTLSRASQVDLDGNRWVITEGTLRGTNLFHSFEEFSVPENGTASFQGIDPAIANIFARVTGQLRSNINGTIEALQTNGALSSANLFLLNPNGILFGPNARLNLGGSFIATTADRIQFANGVQFSASTPQDVPLLTVSTPIGLQFGSNPGRIMNRSMAQNFSSSGEVLLDPFDGEARGLRVLPGQTLALVGGSIRLRGGGLVAGSENTEPGGRIELASVGANEVVRLIPSTMGWSLGVTPGQNFDDIRLSQGAIVNTSGNSGGAIVVQGRNIRLSGGSQFLSVTQAGRGESMIVNATDRLIVTGASDQGNSLLYTETQASGSAGNIQLSARQLQISDAGFITSLSSGSGEGGDVMVNAVETIEVIGRPSSLVTLADGDGAAGDLQISTRQLHILEGGEVGSIASSTGRGGNVMVNASESVNIIGISTAPELTDDNRGGNLLAQTQANGENAGAAGNITVTTDRLLLQNGGQIASSTVGGGDAGRLTVRARDIELTGIALDDDGSPFLSSLEDGSLPYPSGLFSGTGPGSTGSGGQLRVTADRLSLRNGAVLQTNTFGSGNAGNMEIRVREFITVSGRAPGNLIPTGITAISGGFPGSGFREVRRATGSSGNIQITTQDLRLEDGAVIATSSINPAAAGAGQLQIQARSIALSNNAQLNARTESGGRDSATIDLRGLELLSLQGGSQITTRAGIETGGGNGGTIRIQARYIVAEPVGDNDISADAGQGDGGDVDITANIIGLVQQDRPTSPQSGITASSEQGVSGTITIRSPEFDPTRGLLELPTDIVDRSRLIARTCRPANPDAPQSAFVITGRGGLPSSPRDPGSSNPVESDWVTLPPQTEPTELSTTTAISPETAMPELATGSQPPNSQTIVEAQGWQIGTQGEIELVAYSQNRSIAPAIEQNPPCPTP
jgi:filamentous hemagglutinin family protein